jgi:CarboxypepD_reg-like domain/TonB-dependent Receptor Plug Domain
MKMYLIIILLIGSLIASEKRVTLSGYILDESSSESLIGANVYSDSLKIGTSSNSYGYYSLSIPAKENIQIVFSYVGYKPQVKKLYLKTNLKLNIVLTPQPISTEDIVVTARKKNENIEKKQMSVIDVPVRMVKQLPAILGETDVLKVIQLLPGVQSGSEGTTGFYVRGGNADQNLVLLDEAVVYNPNHLFGLLSTFNSRAINNVTLIKGGFPAQFGGRLSSILDISMKEGNNKSYHVDGGLGLITSRLTIEGPLISDKVSFIISARRTYLDLLLKAFPSLSNTQYAFYDLNAKVNYKLSDADRFFLSYFSGADNAAYIDASSLNYDFSFGNSAGTLRWNHLFGDKLFSNTSVIYNTYLMNLKTNQGNFFSEFYSQIKDITAKTGIEYFPNPVHTIKFGAQFTRHTITPTGTSGNLKTDSLTTIVNTSNIQKKIASEGSLYINDAFNISNSIGMNLGLRFSAFKNNKSSHYGVEPRATLRYTLSTESSIKAAYSVMNQYLHLVPSSTASFPTDIWLPSSKVVKPQRSEQYAFGYFRNFEKNMYETSIEAYYKTMQNQVAFKEGTHLLEQTDIDQQLVFGKGWSYGIEFLLKKRGGRYSGWISYTLSWTNQQFQNLNFGKTFPFKYDKRHDLSIVGNYNLNKQWTISSNFVFTSGNVVTLPEGRVNIYEGGDLYNGVFDIYNGRNNYRLGNYHRLDVSATYKYDSSFFSNNYDGELVFSIYNLYSHLNPYFVYVDVDGITHKPYAKQVSLLSIIPSLSFNFSF